MAVLMTLNDKLIPDDIKATFGISLKVSSSKATWWLGRQNQARLQPVFVVDLGP